MNRFWITLIALGLTGCGSSGALNADLQSYPIPPQHARISVTRSQNLLYLAMGSIIRLNGAKVATLARGGSVMKDIPVGMTSVEVNSTLGPGRYVATFQAEAAKTYAFEVSPREGSYASSMLWGIAGDAINAQVKENTGYFKIVPVEAK